MRETPNQPGCAAAPANLAAAVLTALGAGCYLGWQTIDISPTLFPTPGPGVDEALTTWGYASTLALVALLALLAALAHRAGSLLRRPWMLPLAALGPAAGTALLYLCGWSDHPLMAGVACGKLLFAASAALLVLWGEMLGRVPGARTLACVAGAYAVSFGICLLEANLAPQAALVFRPLLPLLSGVALAALRQDLAPALAGGPARPAGPGAAGRDGAEDEPAVLLPVRLFVGTGILGAVFIATNHLSETKTAVSTELYTLVAGVAVALALLFVGLAARRRGANFALLYRLITPLVIGCLLLTLVLEPGSQRYEALAIGGAWAFFRMFTWTLWARVASRDGERGAYVFALGQVALTTCSTASELLCTAVDLATVPLVGAGAAIIFATVVTSALVMDEGLPARGRGQAVSGMGAGAQGAAELDPVARAFAPGTEARGAASSAPAAPDPAHATADDLARACAGLDLSERERGIALLVLRGLDNGAICGQACITESTLRTHLRNIYAKAGVHSRNELIDLLAKRLEGLGR